MLKIDVWNIAFTVVNLLVLYWFMKRYLLGPVAAILLECQSMIEHDLDAASDAKSEVLEMKKQYEASMGNADKKAAEIVAAARVKAGGEYDKILKRANADARKKPEQIEKIIALEQEKSLHELETPIAGLVMTAATRLLEETKDSTQDKAVYDGFLKKAGESHD